MYYWLKRSEQQPSRPPRSEQQPSRPPRPTVPQQGLSPHRVPTTAPQRVVTSRTTHIQHGSAPDRVTDHGSAPQRVVAGGARFLSQFNSLSVSSRQSTSANTRQSAAVQSRSRPSSTAAGCFIGKPIAASRKEGNDNASIGGLNVRQANNNRSNVRQANNSNNSNNSRSDTVRYSSYYKSESQQSASELSHHSLQISCIKPLTGLTTSLTVQPYLTLLPF